MSAMPTVFLSEAELGEVVAWRRKLHAMPELSGEEAETAREVCAFLRPRLRTRC